MINTDFIEGCEFHGYTMKCGIFVFNIISPCHAMQTILIESECLLSEALRTLADSIGTHGLFKNDSSTIFSAMCRPSNAEIIGR